MKRLGGLLACAVAAIALPLPAASALAKPTGHLVFELGCDTLCLTAPDGSSPQPIHVPEAIFPAFSRDGRRLAYVTSDGLVVADRDGRHARVILPHWTVQSPTWSPDGRFIAFSGGVAAGDAALYVVGADGSHPHWIPGPKGARAPADAMQPSWSPDGKEIAFATESATRKTSVIYVVHPNGKGWHRLMPPSSQSEGQPTWTPNGRWLLFERTSLPDTAEIVRVTAAGKAPRILTRGNYWNGPPAVSPDSRFVAFTRHHGGQGLPDVYIVPLAGGVTKHVPIASGALVGWTR